MLRPPFMHATYDPACIEKGAAMQAVAKQASESRHRQRRLGQRRGSQRIERPQALPEPWPRHGTGAAQNTQSPSDVLSGAKHRDFARPPCPPTTDNLLGIGSRAAPALSWRRVHWQATRPPSSGGVVARAARGFKGRRAPTRRGSRQYLRCT